MRIAFAVALIGLVAMSAALIFGVTAGDFSAEGARLMAMPWGIVSLVDLYVGFALFSCWIIFRERSWMRSAVWVLLMMLLGFWAGALYTFMALRASDPRKPNSSPGTQKMKSVHCSGMKLS